jgi:hypothetical protein
MARARENPIELAVWLIAALAAAATGTVVYVAAKKSASNAAATAATTAANNAVLTGPAITNPEAGGAGNSVAEAANAAFVADQQAAAAAAAANAAHLATLTDTTYQLSLSGQAPSATASFLLKVGDTIQITPSMAGDPPVARVWAYSPVSSSSIIQELGSADGVSATFKATAPGSGVLLVQNVMAGNQNVVYMTYTVNVEVIAT